MSDDVLAETPELLRLLGGCKDPTHGCHLNETSRSRLDKLRDYLREARGLTAEGTVRGERAVLHEGVAESLRAEGRAQATAAITRWLLLDPLYGGPNIPGRVHLANRISAGDHLHPQSQGDDGSGGER